VGVYLPAGFAIRPENGADEDIVTFTWQACTAQLCEALVELNDDQIAALSAAEGTVIASYRPGLRAEPLVFRLSMAGLEPGLAALRPRSE
jgi:invasion protein IalB